MKTSCETSQPKQPIFDCAVPHGVMIFQLGSPCQATSGAGEGRAGEYLEKHLLSMIRREYETGKTFRNEHMRNKKTLTHLNLR